MEMRQTVYLQDGPIDAVYFPISGMVSMVTNLSDGMQAEVGIVGREGADGIAIMFGSTSSFVESMVQIPGQAYRIEAQAFLREVDANPSLRDVILRSMEALQAQIMQTAACNGRHGLEQRLARWLLMASDRVDGRELPLTQELIAMMLGVHRPSITVTAGILQRAGLIRYTAGRITIVDRASLEAAACECYAAVRRRFDSLFKD